MNPAVAFHDIKTKAHTIILTSGTLSPMDSFSSELDCAFGVVHQGPHVIDLQSQVWVGSVPSGPNNVKIQCVYQQSKNTDMQDEIGNVLVQYCKNVPFGILCFMPSYAMLHSLEARWKEAGIWEQMQKHKHVFVETRAKDGDFDTMIKQYYQSISDHESHKGTKTGGVFFAVCRGKISEGIDFSDNRARLVVCVGIPFPALKDLQVANKKKFNSDRCRTNKQLLTGDKWYALQAYRSLNQAIGRMFLTLVI